MGHKEDYILEIVEDVVKQGHSIVKATLNTLFKVHGGDLILSAKDTYFNERFKWRLEDFVAEEKNICDEDIKKFYENINHQQLNYLFELFEKARTSTFDLHAKILSKLYANLLQNRKLSYYESVLLSNINVLIEQDFLTFRNTLNNIKDKNLTVHTRIPFTTQEELHSIQKFINLGILINHDVIYFDGLGKKEFLELYRTEFSLDLYHMLNTFY